MSAMEVPHGFHRPLGPFGRGPGCGGALHMGRGNLYPDNRLAMDEDLDDRGEQAPRRCLQGKRM